MVLLWSFKVYFLIFYWTIFMELADLLVKRVQEVAPYSVHLIPEEQFLHLDTDEKIDEYMLTCCSQTVRIIEDAFDKCTFKYYLYSKDNRHYTMYKKNGIPKLFVCDKRPEAVKLEYDTVAVVFAGGHSFCCITDERQCYIVESSYQDHPVMKFEMTLDEINDRIEELYDNTLMINFY
jgi:hypothetical protein